MDNPLSRASPFIKFSLSLPELKNIESKRKLDRSQSQNIVDKVLKEPLLKKKIQFESFDLNNMSQDRIMLVDDSLQKVRYSSFKK